MEIKQINPLKEELLFAVTKILTVDNNLLSCKLEKTVNKFIKKLVKQANKKNQGYFKEEQAVVILN